MNDIKEKEQLPIVPLATSVFADRQKDRWTDGLTDGGHSYNPIKKGIKK
jgi:hypothetical protein